ncbi:MAG: glycosyltransferase family 2 protein [Anaerolineae bacterium]|nr:glycosyltransferase family 2 protein [Anaerolineae bacterium]
MTSRTIILIPAYNEGQSITQVIERLRQVVPHYDRVIINDGSSDHTAQVVRTLGERLLHLPCNLGYGLALQTGMKYALLRGYETIVTLDADGQHQPEDVPLLVQALEAKRADMVIGSRYCGGRPYIGPFSRTAGQRLFSHLTRLLIGRRIYDTSSGFKAMRASVCRTIVDRTFMDLHTETIVRLSLLGFVIEEVPVTVQERQHGQSMHSWVSIFRYPLMTLMLTLVAAMDVWLRKRE